MFKVDKKVIGELERCYSLAMLHYQGKDHFLCAAEKVNNCYLISLDGKIEETVWEGPGGVMTMVQVPGTDGQFLATRKFYSPNDSKEASIVVVTPKGKDDWEVGYYWPLPMGKMAMRLRSLTVAAAQRMCYTMFMKARTSSSARTARLMKSRATS